MSLPFRTPSPKLGVGFVRVPPAWVTEGGGGGWGEEGPIEATVTFLWARLRPFARTFHHLSPSSPFSGRLYLIVPHVRPFLLNFSSVARWDVVHPLPADHPSAQG